MFLGGLAFTRQPLPRLALLAFPRLGFLSLSCAALALSALGFLAPSTLLLCTQAGQPRLLCSLAFRLLATLSLGLQTPQGSARLGLERDLSRSRELRSRLAAAAVGNQKTLIEVMPTGLADNASGRLALQITKIARERQSMRHAAELLAAVALETT
jgi:hypothetical protein